MGLGEKRYADPLTVQAGATAAFSSSNFDLQTWICFAVFDDEVVAGDEFFEGVASLASIKRGPFQHVRYEKLGDIEDFDHFAFPDLVSQVFGMERSYSGRNDQRAKSTSSVGQAPVYQLRIGNTGHMSSLSISHFPARVIFWVGGGSDSTVPEMLERSWLVPDALGAFCQFIPANKVTRAMIPLYPLQQG